ncbi:hypothetical protein [Virgibacillus halodenitrificans]|uniref:Uncharacterized protein n=1 Tax=Virgibacillus halodenitrificans TaxID=1482 RepID=A0ABR7VN72_VIRHA|nr:hypothetical protein [Virgibacillus halodenitrificans]MBD1222756.1 hypothetical protein [Virgibacillus halodenitrificans]
MEFLKNMFMYEADNGTNTGGNNSSENNNDNDKGNPSDDSKNTDKTIPYERFKEVNDNFKQVKDELAELKKKQQEDEEEDKRKQGEYESLYNDLKSTHDPLKEQFDAYQEVFKEMLQNRLEEVPEDFRDLIPNGNELEQMKWIENATKKGLFKKNNVQSFGNNGNNPGEYTNVTQEDFNKMRFSEKVKLKKENPLLYNKLI